MATINPKRFILCRVQDSRFTLRAKQYKTSDPRSSRRYIIFYRSDLERWSGQRIEFGRDPVHDLPQKLVFALWLSAALDDFIGFG